MPEISYQAYREVDLEREMDFRFGRAVSPFLLPDLQVVIEAHRRAKHEVELDADFRRRKSLNPAIDEPAPEPKPKYRCRQCNTLAIDRLHPCEHCACRYFYRA